ncbi:MAG: helix-hairpin-helix domain-containing protein, partial [Acidobacteriota bacterium]
VVPKDQLSLAIGRKGQNVRLASRLIGWEINIKSEIEKKEEVIGETDRLERKGSHPASLLDGVDDQLAELLAEADITTVETIAGSTVEGLLESEGVDEELAQSLQSEAADFIAALKNQDNNTAPADEHEKDSAED